MAGNSTVAATGIDFGFWGFILGAIGTVGTVLSSILVVLQIRQMRGAKVEAKTDERESEVKILFQSIRPALVLYDDQTNPNYEWDFLKEIKPCKTLILQTEHSLQKTDSGISAKLKELLSILDKTGYFQYDIMTVGEAEIARNPRVKVLVSELRKDVDKWLSKHV